jgi:3-oxoadipate enol-lactonase
MTTPDGAVERLVTTADGVRLLARLDPVHDRSTAPTLLVVNSLGCDHAMWDGQVASWRTTHHVLRYDQRGHGGSDAPDGPYDLDRLGRDALAVLDAFEVDRADVCGLSLGGLVAQWLCVAAGERVHRAVLADTAARIGTRDGWLERAALVRHQGMDAVTEPVLDRFFSPQARAGDIPAVAQVRAVLAGMSPEGYASSCEALALADLHEEVATISHDCLVVVGTADVATPPADAHELVASVPHATYAELVGAGHLSNLERSGEFTALVADFLAAPTGRALDPVAGRHPGTAPDA